MLPFLLADVSQKLEILLLRALEILGGGYIFRRAEHLIGLAVFPPEIGVTGKAQPLEQAEQSDFGAAYLLAQLFQGEIAYFPWMVAYICDDLLLFAGEHPIRRVEILVEQNRKIDQTHQPLSL